MQKDELTLTRTPPTPDEYEHEYNKHNLNARFFRKLSAALVIALMLIALEVFIGKALRADMWISIALYWLVLTVKNLADWRCAAHTRERDAIRAEAELAARMDEIERRRDELPYDAEEDDGR